MSPILAHIEPQLDPPLQEDNFEDEDEFRKLARYLAGEGWIENFGDGFLMFTITREGRKVARGESPQQPQVASQTFNVGTAYGSAFGSQNVTINNSFDMRTVEAELDRAEQEADRLAEPDATEIKKLIAELRGHLHSGEPLEAGKLARFWRVFKEYGFLVSPVVGALVNLAFRSATGIKTAAEANRAVVR